MVPGDLYVFEVVAPNGRAGPAHWDAANPYPAGDAYIWTSTTGVYDFGFETISAREGLTRGGDTDQDTVCDDVDQCAGEDDTIDDTPANGTPDCAEDPCLAFGGDADADGFCDGGEDLCPDMPNAVNTDTNGDGIGDACYLPVIASPLTIVVRAYTPMSAPSILVDRMPPVDPELNLEVIEPTGDRIGADSLDAIFNSIGDSASYINIGAEDSVQINNPRTGDHTIIILPEAGSVQAGKSYTVSIRTDGTVEAILGPFVSPTTGFVDTIFI